jgi:hypothetical protein
MIMVKEIRDKVIKEFIYIACGESEDAADKERTSRADLEADIMDEDGGGGDGRGEEQEAAAEQLMEKEAAVF